MTRYRVYIAFVLALTLWPFGASAQKYPDRAVKMIVPFVPGSPVDATARIVAQYLQPRLGQGLIVENRAGGGTSIGVRAVATAQPDGYTLLLNGSSTIYIPALYPSVDDEAVRNLVPISPLVTWSHVIVVEPSVPVKNLVELVAYVKANPGKVSFGYGQGTVPHILGQSLRRAADLDLVMVSYRGGEQARADLLGGRVLINIAPTANLLPLIQDGKARAVAYTGITRHPELPDVPTTAESGYPSVGYNPDVWLGLFAPRGTPAAIVEQINTAVADMQKSPEMKAALAKLGFEAKVSTPQEFTAFLAGEAKKWPPLLADAGIKGD
ncbi:MAG TPA: tripartite tricarboxylate transporter substrate binding protein [Xanthobacteraceae bacterium]|nr:tripartite tricarboxylate transporter substrate binding protein [Xanthobacteraceae bacterium]